MIYALAFKRRVCSDSSVSHIPKRKHLACTDVSQAMAFRPRLSRRSNNHGSCASSLITRPGFDVDPLIEFIPHFHSDDVTCIGVTT